MPVTFTPFKLSRHDCRKAKTFLVLLLVNSILFLGIYVAASRRIQESIKNSRSIQNFTISTKSHQFNDPGSSNKKYVRKCSVASSKPIQPSQGNSRRADESKLIYGVKNDWEIHFHMSICVETRQGRKHRKSIYLRLIDYFTRHLVAWPDETHKLFLRNLHVILYLLK